VAVPSLPQGFEALRDWLKGLETRVGLLEEPKQPGRVYSCTKAQLPAAASFVGCVARVTDVGINILVHSDGSNWKREDTGATV
jgi:hypothetical protein